MMVYKQELVSSALAMGAKNAVPFCIDQIVFDSRTLLKCMFGCTDWGKLHTCPSRPGSPSIEEYKQMLTKYSWGLIIHSNDKRIAQHVSYEIERRAFLDGYYFAFSLSDCAICSSCGGHSDTPCRFPQKARPAFHSVGIDVFATVKKFGLPLETLKSDTDEQNWYSAVFIE